MPSHLITFLALFIYLTYLVPYSLSAIISDAVRAQLEEILPAFDPNTYILQSLCAQGTQGGTPLAVGGYCFHAPDPTTPDTSGRVVFRAPLPYHRAPWPGTFSEHLLQVHRFRAECLLRCFCTNTNSTVGPNVVAVPRNLQRQPKYIGYDHAFRGSYPPRLTFPSQQTTRLQSISTTTTLILTGTCGQIMRDSLTGSRGRMANWT